MRRYEKKTTTRTDDVCVELRCDLCGREGSPSHEWETGIYDVDETEVRVTVRAKDGTAHGSEGGSGTETAFDICPTCFHEKLIPWLKSQGATARKQEWDY